MANHSLQCPHSQANFEKALKSFIYQNLSKCTLLRYKSHFEPLKNSMSQFHTAIRDPCKPQFKLELINSDISGFLFLSRPKFSLFCDLGGDLRLKSFLLSTLRISRSGYREREICSRIKTVFPDEQRCPPELVIIGSSLTNNYFHWMSDVLGDIFLLTRHGYNVQHLPLIAVPSLKQPWQKEVLDLLEIKNAIGYDDLPRLQPSKCLIPMRHKGIGKRLPVWQVSALRSVLGSLVEDEPYSSSNNILYISRQRALRRRIINENNLIHRLKEFGAKIVALEDFTVSEQILLFQRAKVIIGAHGAGFTNIAFCPIGAKLIDIFPETRANPCFSIIAHQAGVRYEPYWAQAIPNGKNANFDDIFLTESDISSLCSLITHQ